MTQPTAAQVRTLRLQLCLTQAAFVTLCKLKHYQNISAIERGARRMSSVRWELLRVTLDQRTKSGSL